MGTSLMDEVYRSALDLAFDLLGRRARSEMELWDRLAAVGYDADIVDGVMSRLRELGLVDDIAFARAFIEEKAERKLVAGEILVGELQVRGIDPDVARRAVAEAGLDDEARAVAEAARRLGRLAGLPIATQAARLQGALLRRGFSDEVAEAAVRRVLPPEGWD